MKSMINALLLAFFLMGFKIGAVAYGPVTVKPNDQTPDPMAAAPAMTFPSGGKGVVEFVASVTPGNNLYKVGMILSPTQKSTPEDGIVKAILSMCDNMDGTHVNGKEGYIIQQTTANYGFLVQKWANVPMAGTTKLAPLPIAVTSSGQAVQFKVVLDATVLPNILQVFVKKPSSTAYPAAPYMEFSNYGADQLFSVDPAKKTYFYFTGSPYCDVTYSNITVTALDKPVQPPLGDTVVIRPGHGDEFKRGQTLPASGKGVIECMVSTGVASNLYCPGFIFSATPNGNPETGITKLFVNVSGNMDGGHVNGKEASLTQQTNINYGFLLQNYSSVGDAPTVAPLPVEGSSRGQRTMLKIIVDATVLPNVLQVFAKKPSDDDYPATPYFEYTNVGARQMFTVDPDGQTYIGFMGNPYCNLAYSNISVTVLDKPVAQKNGPVFIAPANDSDNFSLMNSSPAITLPTPGKGSVECMVAVGLDENIYRPGFIFSPTQNGDMEDGKTKLIVVAGDNMDGGHTHGKEAYLLQRTASESGKMLQHYSILPDGDKRPATLQSELPVEPAAGGQALMLKVEVDATIKPNYVHVFAKKPSDAAYPTAPYFQYQAPSDMQLFTVSPKGKTYVYFTGSPYCNMAYSKVVTTSLDGMAPSASTPTTIALQPAASAPVVVSAAPVQQVQPAVQSVGVQPAAASPVPVQAASASSLAGVQLAASVPPQAQSSASAVSSLADVKSVVDASGGVKNPEVATPAVVQSTAPVTMQPVVQVPAQEPVAPPSGSQGQPLEPVSPVVSAAAPSPVVASTSSGTPSVAQIAPTQNATQAQLTAVIGSSDVSQSASNTVVQSSSQAVPPSIPVIIAAQPAPGISAGAAATSQGIGAQVAVATAPQREPSVNAQPQQSLVQTVVQQSTQASSSALQRAATSSTIVQPSSDQSVQPYVAPAVVTGAKPATIIDDGLLKGLPAAVYSGIAI